MIRASSAEQRAVTNTIPGNLVLYLHSGSGEWLPCLSVKASNEGVSLLALSFGDDRTPFLLREIDEHQCLQLGKAEARFTFPNLSGARPGPLALGSKGAAIAGRTGGTGGPLIERWWVIATGEPTPNEPGAFRPAAWEIGIYTGADFEQVLRFPLLPSSK